LCFVLLLFVIMYNQLLKDHRAQSAASRKAADNLRVAAQASCEQVSAALFADVQSGVGALYRNQRLLQAEAATLQAHTARFARQSERWLALSTALHTALKEMGDVHNWALTVQKDVRWVERELQQTVQANNDKKIALKERREAEVAAVAARAIAGGVAVPLPRSASAAGAATAPAAAAAAAIAVPAHEPHVHGADEELP
jgi:hypothetical protein